MRKLFFLSTFLLAFATADAQISAGSMKVDNYGDHYRISLATQPYNYNYPYPDSASLRVTVLCLPSGTYEVNNIPLNGVLKYKLSGTHYIASSVIWWKNGVRKSQTCMKTICGFFTNPISCFQKI